VIENGDRGIFVTCERGKERKCAAEILDILAQVSAESIREQ
jgi:tRNA acetyltransferase TAN1